MFAASRKVAAKGFFRWHSHFSSLPRLLVRVQAHLLQAEEDECAGVDKASSNTIFEGKY